MQYLKTGRSRLHIPLFLLLMFQQGILAQQKPLNEKISIGFEEVSIAQALKQLGAQTGYFFNFGNSDVDADRRISKNYRHERLETIIKDVWGSGAIILQVSGRTIEIQSRGSSLSKKKGIIKGKVIDDLNQAVPFASVFLQNTTYGSETDRNGYFSFTAPPGEYILVVNMLGYKDGSRKIRISENAQLNISITITSSEEELNEVIVQGKSKEQEKREEPIKVEVIDTKELQTKSIGLPQIINQTTGVRVRQTGGIGSRTIVNINGQQGRAIRYFRDNIPMDYMGRAFNLELLPVDQVDNIEVYKGVLPAELGADALGGALNFTSRQNFNDNLDFAYTVGSFNTHQLNLNGYYKIPKSKLFVSLASYYVSSDNNYKVTVPLADPVTANLVDTEVERFHDGVESYLVEGKLGLRYYKYDDILEFSYARFDYEKERQNGVQLDPNSAFGEVMDLESSDIFAMRYKLSKGKFSMDAFGSYSNRNTLFIDDPEFRYNWLGEQLPLINQGGEISRTSRFYRQLNFKTWTGRINAKYKLGKKHDITFNHNFISEDRIGSDTLEIIFGTDIDPNSLPSNYTRNITGLAWSSSFFKDKVKNVVTAKRFSVNTASISRTGAVLSDGDLTEIKRTNYGLGNSTKLSIEQDRFIRISYEYATRIPENIEFLGDGLFILGNPNLRPETSHNINLGYYTPLSKSKRHWMDINLFHRFVMDNIFLTAAGFAEGIFENQNDAKIYGAELSLKGELVPSLYYSFSTTYQDIRRANSRDPNIEGARQPNVPYFFSNVNLRYNHPKTVLKGNWDSYLNYGFVEKFLLSTVPKELEPALFGPVDKINTTAIIDTQHTLDVGVTYKRANAPLWISLEVNNVLDIPVFDGFRVQLPGRNFRLKLKYIINAKNRTNEKLQ